MPGRPPGGWRTRSFRYRSPERKYGGRSEKTYNEWVHFAGPVLPAMRDFLLIYVNGKRHEIRGASTFGSLSSFLRYELRLTGTKVVCAEGDCGSWSVLLG